jgi:hypothetical protein
MGRGAYITNLHPIPSIVTLDKPGIKIRDMIGSTSQPKMNDGTEMCLSFHLQNGCWSNPTHRGPPSTRQLKGQHGSTSGDI